MKVLIANPPAYIGDRNRHFVQAGSRWSHSSGLSKENACAVDHYHPYPFFIGYASALLKRDTDAEVRALDACSLDFDESEFVECVERYDPDLLVVEVPTITFPLVMPLLERIKDDVGCKISVAGGHVTALTDEVANNYKFIDYPLVGEYEVKLKRLVLSGEIDRKREPLTDLDSLPFPDRDDLQIKKYHDFEIAGKPCVQMITSRGCPFNCSFCLERQVLYASPVYRTRNPQNVVDEMELVKEKYGAKQVHFDDQTITCNKSHIRSICAEIISRNFDMPWSCMGDITIDYETLLMMRNSGLVAIRFGIETVAPDVLKGAGKTFVNIQKAKQFREWCRKLGIWTHAAYTIGLPGDNKERIQATLNFALELDTEFAQFSIATPLPGTPFYETIKRNGWLTTTDWTKYDGTNSSVVSYPWMSAKEIEDEHCRAVETWAVKKQGRLRLAKALVRASGFPRTLSKMTNYLVRQIT